MSKGLPTINPKLYDDQLFNNNERMQGLLETIFPNLLIPYDIVYRIIAYLEETQINGMILPDVIRAIYNLHIGSGEGQVVIHVRSGITNVQLREQNPTRNLLGEFEKIK